MDATDENADAIADLIDAREQLEDAITRAAAAGLSVGEIAAHLDADPADVERLSGEA